jgi:hypothetical protein
MILYCVSIDGIVMLPFSTLNSLLSENKFIKIPQRTSGVASRTAAALNSFMFLCLSYS